MEKLNEKKGKIEDEIKNLEIVLNKNRYFCDDFFELEEFINWNKRELSILEEKNDISGYVEEYIKRAHMDLMDNANSILDITMDKYFIYITAWQYQDVKVEFGEDNRLYFKVFSKKANAFLNDDILSESTLDQLYIAFRLAMIELIDEKGFFPVVLDETFSFFDTNRLESTCSLFLNIASNRQVIYFNGNQSITDFFKNKKEVSQINLND
jgi:uncharacterized protein YhaN